MQIPRQIALPARDHRARGLRESWTWITRALAGLLVLLAPLALQGTARGDGFGVSSAGSVWSGSTTGLDQVFVRDPKTGAVSPTTCTVAVDGLGGVEVDDGNRTFTIPSERVTRVQFGGVPESFAEGLAYLQREDFENAAAKLRHAASNAEREPVRAAARLAATHALLRLGTQEESFFQEALDEATRFLTDHPGHRQTPTARWMQAMARHLNGDSAAAAAEFRALYDEANGASPNEGYDLLGCYKAGLLSAEAHLVSGDVDSARSVFSEIDAALPGVLAELEEDSGEYVDFAQVQVEARLGEGRCLLAAGSGTQARTFFEGQLAGAGEDKSLEFGALLGLAEALLAEGSVREAWLRFGQVATLDTTSRDRTARALVGLLLCSQQLSDDDSAQVDAWIETLLNDHADSFWVKKALELR